MIYPGAIWNPGAAAGYRNGRNAMRACVLHYTVGVDSTGVGLRGYFHFLVSKDGRVQQFCEADAIAWHAGEWNGQGPGIEFERMGDWEPLTPEQIAAGGALVRWLIGMGIVDNFYDGPRLAAGSYAGFITHRSLQQSSPHSDYVTAQDWAGMRGTTYVAPASTAPAPVVQTVWGPGSTGDKVREIQHICNVVGCNAGAEDGIYGQQTASAVACWQTKLKVGADGVWGPQTQAANDKFWIWIASQTAAAPPPPPPPATGIDAGLAASLADAMSKVWKLGSAGDGVKWVQALCGRAGFDAGPVDGIFGSRTARAVLAFQSSRGLTADAIVGPQTWAALTR